MNNIKKKSISITRDNIRLSGILEIPELSDGKKCPLVIFMHARMMDSRELLFEEISHNLLNNHIASLRFDFNGHGYSDGKFEDMTVLNEIEDAAKVLEYAKSLPFISSISILGHSQGGLVAGMTAGYYLDDIASLVLMAPAGLLIKEQALSGRLMGTRFDPNNIPPYISIFGTRVGRAYVETAQTLPIDEVSSLYKGPVCLIHGTSDGMVSYKVSEHYHEIYADSELYLQKGQDHAFYRYMDDAVNIAVDFIVRKVKENKYN